MITRDVIDSIYKKYKTPPGAIDELSLALLFDYAIENHGIYVDDGDLVIESIGEDSPFHTIPLSRVHGIVEFERQIAIVLPNAILFLNKADDGVNIHLRQLKQSLFDRIREKAFPITHPEF